MTTTDYELYSRGIRRPRIYVSGPMARAPYTGPRAAFLLAQKLWRAGWHPIVPHANALFELAAGALDPDSADGIGGWLEYDFSMMGDVSFLVRVESDGMAKIPSSGTDREIALAEHSRVGITVLTEEQALLGAEWCRTHEFRDVTGELCDTLKEVDDALREKFPTFDHTKAAGERIEHIADALAVLREQLLETERMLAEANRQVAALECDRERLREDLTAAQQVACRPTCVR